MTAIAPLDPLTNPRPKAQANAPIGIFDSGVTAWFLEPNDAAISKYVRSEARDREWIRAGLQAGILSLPRIEYRLRETVMETSERQQAKNSIAEDKAWLASLQLSEPLSSCPNLGLK